MINIILIGRDIKYFRKLINSINIENPNIKICGIADTINEIMLLISKLHIDIMLVDTDSFEAKYFILNNKNYKDKVCLIINDKGNKTMFNNNENYIIKNQNVNKVIEQINTMLIDKLIKENLKQDGQEEKNVRNKIKKELNSIGYNYELLGTTYIEETIYILYTLKDYYGDNFERDIYPIVAKKYGKTVHNIKCNIRNATDIMYLENEIEVLKEYFEKDNLNNYKSKKIIKTVLEKISNKNETFFGF